jgi:hypothetical protein
MNNVCRNEKNSNFRLNGPLMFSVLPLKHMFVLRFAPAQLMSVYYLIQPCIMLCMAEHINIF